MIFKVKAGTDAASLVLFDPQSLPEGWDQQWKQGESIDELAALDDDGRLFWINTEGDGDYSLHAFLDESTPAQLIEFVAESRDANQFQVLSGQVCFAGAEYIFRDDNSALQRDPDMGSVFPVANGKYDVALRVMTYPEHFIEEHFKARTTPSQSIAYQTFNRLVPCSIVFVFAAIASLFLESFVVRAVLVSSAALLLFGVFAVNRLAAYKSAVQVRTEIEGEYPDYVAVFRPVQSLP
jgi:hypothetical protein